MSNAPAPEPAPLVLAIDSKKYRRRGVWTMVGEVVALQPVALVEGVPGPLLSAFLRRYDLDSAGHLLGVVIDGSDALRRCLEGAYAGRNRSLLLAANPYHFVKTVLAPVLDRARESRAEFVAAGGAAGLNLTGRERLLLPDLDDLDPVEERPVVEIMLKADPLLAALHGYGHDFARRLADGDTRAVLAWADSPPVGCEWRTRAPRAEVWFRIGQIAALFELRRLTGRAISTGQVEALQRRVAQELDLRGGRGTPCQAMAAVMARRAWSAERIAAAARDLL